MTTQAIIDALFALMEKAEAQGNMELWEAIHDAVWEYVHAGEA